jgi:hypothetical protein
MWLKKVGAILSLSLSCQVFFYFPVMPQLIGGEKGNE